MEIDYNKLHVFLKVVACQGVTKAAKELHRTQSAVSQAVLSLERQLGSKLIQWEGKRLQLTREGKILYSLASARMAAIDEELTSLAVSGHEVAGSIEIGMLNDYSTNMHELVIEKIAEFRKSYPKVTFQIHFQTSDKIEQALLAQELDIGFFINFQQLHRFQVVEITTEQHLVVTSPKYLKKRGPIKSVQDVLQSDLIDIDQHFTCFSPWVNFHAAALQEQLETKKPIISAANFRLIKELTLNGEGIAVLPHYLIKQELRSHRLVKVLPKLLPLRVWVHAALLLGRTLRLAEQLFLNAWRS